MPEFVADFHIHSRYSRACSKDLSVPELAKWAKIKGIGVLGTGDFTHPLWLQELKDTLRDTGRGLFEHDGAQFMLTAEVNTLFYRRAKAHNVHHVLLAPSFEAVERINDGLSAFGSLSLDGRPILHMDAWRLAEVVLGLEPRCLIVPAHAWTPHFAIFGSNSGFDSVEECFEHQAKNIHVLETGLSSDPAMNWRLSALDRYALISNSDSHSARRIGREANVFDCEPSYDAIVNTLKAKDRAKFLYTVEFFPEEGKYHFDGHRKCGIRYAPAQTRQQGGRCPVCGRALTVGVMSRVEKLADRPEGVPSPHAVPFKHSVPLEEIIADALGVGVGTQAVDREYFNLIDRCGTEFAVLLKAPEEQLRKAAPAKIAEGILRMRRGDVTVAPGYDGEYGKVHIFGGEAEAQPTTPAEQQMTLF
ncbi:MAG: DNA helicase UvrD [Candidatus Omnitrophica bacterium]|nr:DNA helicase UvrD [Candidatus Omnitrophota bacterium]